MFRVSELFFTLLLCASCAAGQDSAPPGDPPTAQSVSIPTPPATGVNPVTGWAGGLFGATATYTHDLNTVSFHGGTWTVPIPVHVGQALSDVAFTVEAPTGNPGDPTSIRVGLYSNGNALAFAALTPAGVGTRVTSDIPLGSRVVAPGETYELEFAPLTTGGYAMSDTKIDAIGMQLAASPRTYKLSALSGTMVGSGYAQTQNGSLTGNWIVNNGDLLALNLPVRDGQIFQSVSSSVYASQGSTITMSLFEQDDAFHVASEVGHVSTTPQNQPETLPITSTEQVTNSTRSYFLQFRVSRSSSDPGQPLIGPVYLVMLE